MGTMEACHGDGGGVLRSTVEVCHGDGGGVPRGQWRGALGKAEVCQDQLGTNYQKQS